MSEPNTDHKARVEAFLKNARAETEKEMARRRAETPEGRLIPPPLKSEKVKRDLLLVSVPKQANGAAATIAQEGGGARSHTVNDYEIHIGNAPTRVPEAEK
jgi:hypothetical protein